LPWQNPLFGSETSNKGGDVAPLGASTGVSPGDVKPIERLGDVGHEILDIFEPDRQTQQIIADAVALALIGRDN
jgi:hypothetical protein